MTRRRRSSASSPRSSRVTCRHSSGQQSRSSWCRSPTCTGCSSTTRPACTSTRRGSADHGCDDRAGPRPLLMLRTIVTRLLLLIPVVILVSFGTFILVDLVPGDPALQVLGPNSTAEEYNHIRAEMGLDEPIVQR